DEEDEEKKTEGDLEKTMQDIVDAKAGAALDANMKKKEEAGKTAASTIFGRHAVHQGNLRCGPGARATPFEEARAADELQHTNLVRDGGAGAGAAAGAAG
ncbi:unnamed protein product, partial [Pylaiella littoralis]